MTAYSKPIRQECASGLVSQEIQELGAPAPADIQQKTKTMAQNQKTKGPLRKQTRESVIIEEAHCTGAATVPQSIRRKHRTVKHKPTSVADKEERAKAIRERRDACARAKGPLGPLYEGWGFDFGVKDATIEGFTRMFESITAQLKDVINNNKNIVEHVFKIEPEVFAAMMVVIPLVCSCVALFRTTQLSMGMRILLGALLTLRVTHSAVKDMGVYLTNYLLRVASGLDPQTRHQEDLIDLEAIHDDLMEYVNDLEAPAQEERPKGLVDRIVSWFEGIEYEGMLDHGVGPIALIMSEIATSATGMITGFLASPKDKNFVRRLMDNKRLITDANYVCQEILKWIAKNVDYVFRTDFSSMFNKNRVLDKWGEEVMALYAQFTEGNLKMSATNARRVNALQMRGVHIAADYATMDMGAWTYHRYCTSMIDKMETVLGAAGVTVSERQVPLTICLRGEPGIGKSYLMHAIIDHIAMKVLDKDERLAYMDNHQAEKYVYLTEEDHVNGYTGQFACIFDDFSQFLTAKGQKDDSQAIIRTSNAAPCRLNAAELAKKGKLFFSSSVILCSTNMYEYRSPSIAKPEAVIRRFHVWVDMVPKVEYCTDETANGTARQRRLDSSKLKAALEYNACEYRIMKCTDMNNQVFAIDKVVDFDGLIDICMGKYNENKQKHEGLMEALRQKREEMHKDALDAEYESGLFTRAYDWFVGKKEEVCKSVSERYTDLRKKMKDSLMKHYLRVKLPGFRTGLAAVVAILVALGLAVASYKLLNSRREPELGDFKYEAELLGDGGDEPALFHNRLMKSILDRNVYHMYKPDDDVEKKDSFGKVTMVTGTKGIFNYHYIAQFMHAQNHWGMTHIKLVAHGNHRNVHMVPIDWFLGDEHVVVDMKSDLAMVQFDKAIPVCRDIVKHFVTKEAVDQNRDFNTSLFIPKSPKCLTILDVMKRRLTAPIVINGNVHDNTVVYKADTGKGDCGSLLAYTGDYANTVERIVGVHMAGSNSAGCHHGYATVVTQCKLRDLIAQLNDQPAIHEDIETEGNFLSKEDTCHSFVAKADPPVFQPRRTAITKSALYGALGEVVKMPARLAPFHKDGELQDPVVLAHKRQDSYNVSISPDLVSIVVSDVVKELRPMMSHSGMKLTFEQAVQGHPDLKCLSAIPRQTSAGFSYRADGRVKKGKKDFFGHEGEYVFDNALVDELRKKVSETIATMEEGIVPADRVFTDILKDELLSVAKVLVGKTRMISACDLHMTIIYRIYFGAVCNDIVATRIINGIAVGMNPYGAEWEFFVRLMTGKGPHCVAGDFSGYDNSQSCQLIHATMDVMMELTGLKSAKDRKVMEALAVTLAQPYHASGGSIYELDHGMPSGNPMTSIMNSIFGLIAFRLCWLACTKHLYVTPISSLAGFRTHVKLVMYGDDNVLNISDAMLPHFNQHTMMEKFPMFGLKYTSDDKEDTNPPAFRELKDITFLKRSFRKCEVVGRHVAPLDLDTVTNMVNWTKKGGSANAITIDNCYNAVREWSLHGREVYEKMTALLRPAVKEALDHDLDVPPHNFMVLEAVGFTPDWNRERL